MDLKSKLKELIKNSPTFKNLPIEEQKEKARIMLESNEEALKNFINVFEAELQELQNVDSDYAGQLDEINKSVDEVNVLAKETDRLILKEEENAERSETDEAAEKLLKDLNKD